MNLRLLVIACLMMIVSPALAEGSLPMPLQAKWQDYGMAGVLLVILFWLVRSLNERSKSADKLTQRLVETAIDTNTHVKVMGSKLDNVQRDVEDVKSDVKVIKTTVENRAAETQTRRRTLKNK